MLTCKIPWRYCISSRHCLIITFEESRQKMCFIIFLWSVSICHITHSYEAILWDLQVYLQRHEVAKLELCLSDTVESQGLSYCHTQNFIKHRCVCLLYFSVSFLYSIVWILWVGDLFPVWRQWRIALNMTLTLGSFWWMYLGSSPAKNIISCP